MRFIFPNLLSAALLLLPLAASAQIPFAAKAAPHRTSIQVAFVAVSVNDLDALGINFDMLPLSARRTYLIFATGNIAAQLYQTLDRVHGHVISIAPAIVSDASPATIIIDTKVADYNYQAKGLNGPPVTTFFLGDFQLQGKLILTPHITPGNWVVLDVSSATSSSKPVRFRAVPSGGPIVVVAPNVQGPETPILGSIFRHRDTVPNTQQLLVFITPTILNAGGSSGNITVNPRKELER